MIQLRCPRCGSTVSFAPTDRLATCPSCEYSVQVVSGGALRDAPREPDKDSAITNAMWIIAAIVVVSFGIPIVAGFFGSGKAKLCQVESQPPKAQVYDADELLGETPLEVPRTSLAREIRFVASGFQESRLQIPSANEDLKECRLTTTLLPK